MKQIKILLAALIALCATSCVEGFEDTGFTPQTPDISFEVESVNITNEAQETTIKLNSNLPWMLSCDVTWMSVSPSRGEGGEDITITIKAQRNRTVEARTGTLTARIVDDFTCSMEVIQAPAEAGSTTIYYAKTNGLKENSGLSWGNATTLSNAIYMAADGDIIYVAEGTYTPEDFVSGYSGDDEGYKTFELHSNFSLIGGFPADVTDDTFAPESYAPKAYVVTLSGLVSNSANAYHVVTVTAPQAEGKKVVLNGVTISDGVTSEDGDTKHSAGSAVAHISRGAGMVIGQSTIEMADCIITDNASNEHAGGIMALAGGVVTMENCHIRNNTSMSNAGGVWNSGATFYMNNCTFDNNRSGQQAGAYYSIEEKTTTPTVSRIYNTSFTNNNNKFQSKSGRTGGAIYFRAWTNAVMVNCTVSGNESSGHGGGIEMHSGIAGKECNVTIINSTISDNSSVLNGGGIGIYNLHTNLKLYNTIISGNSCNDAVSSEVGQNFDGVASTSYYNSIVGASLYGTDGAAVSSATFDAGSMLSELGKWSGTFNDTYSYKLIYSEGNPACSGGRSAAELSEIAGDYLPVIDAQMFNIDQRGVARGDKKTIGSTTYDN